MFNAMFCVVISCGMDDLGPNCSMLFVGTFLGYYVCMVRELNWQC